jgi:hypothetical protein
MALVPIVDVANRHSDIVVSCGRNNLPQTIFDYKAGGTINPRRIVKFDTAAGTVVQGAAATDAVIGVSVCDRAAASGDNVPVAVDGVVEVEAGAAITQGTLLTTNANGQATTASTGNVAWGVALESASTAGTVIKARVGARVTV